jgi:hypothetical protein
MDLLRHISLLGQMGVDWYVPRIPLVDDVCVLEKIPVSPATAIKPQPAVIKEHGNDLSEIAVAKSRPSIDFGLDTPKPLVKAEAIETTAKASVVVSKTKAMVENFNLLVISTETLICVCDVKTNPLSAVWERSVRSFFDEIYIALEKTASVGASLDYFSWPLPGTNAVSLGGNQLTQLLNGFMQQRMSGRLKGIVLFGNNSERHMASLANANDARVILAPSLGVVFSKSQYKAALWRDLQAFNDAP